MPETTLSMHDFTKVVEIVQTDFSHLNNGAHFQFIKNVSDRLATDTKIKENAVGQAVIKALTEALTTEDKYLVLSQKSLLTDEIAHADKERDTLFTGYRTAVKGFLNMPIAALAKNARELWQHLADYAIDPQMQLERETGLITNLCTDLVGKYATQVQALGLKPYVDALKTANERVETLLVQRTTDNSTKVVGALRTAREASDNAIRNLTKVVNALAILGNPADYAAFIDFMNTLIKRYKEQAIPTSTAKANVEKHMAEYEARVKPKLASFEEQQGFETGSLSFTGKTKGTAAKRLFELSVKGQKTADGKLKTIWVGVNKDGTLFLSEKANEKPKAEGGTAGKADFGINHK
ncbi:MAG: hypothetical protein HXO07_07495 [Prevotella salivae]|jgi:possible hemagglutinin protein hagB|uniref:DUF6261 family protein n=1 Tax=Segatella salivae TaxID=228604 RepID=UPI001CB1A1C6|nr:DUF6261 family protein [Segatella salivae]MBF1537265.1 hypothetical protein [Segatella salivae]MBF1557458.1 hypothetical protein [Segatella salivae]